MRGRLFCTSLLIGALASIGAFACKSADDGTAAAAPDATGEDAIVDTASDAPAEASGDGAVLGEACSSAGALACAGHAQKAQLLCDGTRWISAGVCAGAQLCDTRPGPTLGSCQDPDPKCTGRTAGEWFCDGSDRRSCGVDLLDSEVVRCESAAHCEQGTADKCAACLDGQFKCDGADLKKCAADRRSFELNLACATATLCDAAGGKCTAPTCAVDEHRCDGDALKKCNDTRTGWTSVKTCPVGLCDGAAKDCRACVPGTKDCAGATPRLCDSSGKWVEGAACSGTTPLCKAGLCSAGACVAGQFRCSGDVLQECNSALTGFDPVAVCGAGLCDATGKECDVCKTGDVGCVGSVPRACDSTGRWKSLVACAGSTPICSAGVCVPGVCTAGEYRCNADTLETCNGTFTGYDLVTTCSPGRCNASMRQCDDCRIGETRCLGNLPQDCDSGRKWRDLTLCSGSTPLCRAGTCIATPSGWVDMTTPTLSPRSGHTAVWTGKDMIVWGGGSGSTVDGASYDFANDKWTLLPVPTYPLSSQRSGHVAVWSGKEMIVWGGTTALGQTADGGYYTPSTGKWTYMNSATPTARFGASAVWSAATNEMIVWGGQLTVDTSATYPRDGGRYNPFTNSWRPMALPPSAFPGRIAHGAVWTGSKLIIFGGYNARGGCPAYACADAAAYDPGTDTWTLLTPPTPALDARRLVLALATGVGSTNATFFGGLAGATVSTMVSRDTGATFNGTGWTVLTTPTDLELNPAKRHNAMGWSDGNTMYVWGGSSDTGTVDTGASYDMATATWAPMPQTNAPSARTSATVVWTGRAAIVWGGTGAWPDGPRQDGKIFWP